MNEIERLKDDMVKLRLDMDGVADRIDSLTFYVRSLEQENEDLKQDIKDTYAGYGTSNLEAEDYMDGLWVFKEEGRAKSWVMTMRDAEALSPECLKLVLSLYKLRGEACRAVMALPFGKSAHDVVTAVFEAIIKKCNQEKCLDEIVKWSQEAGFYE